MAIKTHPSSTAATLLLIIGLFSSNNNPAAVVVEGLTLPNLIGAISHHNRHHLTQRRRQLQRRRTSPNNNGGSQMHNSITLTIDDDDPKGLWNVMSNQQQRRQHRQRHSRRSGGQDEQQRRFIRFGFHFFRPSASSSREDGDVTQRRERHSQQQRGGGVHHSLLVRPYGPLPQGGTLDDLVVLPTASAAAAATGTATAVMQPPSSENKQEVGLWSNVRTAMRGIRHSVISSTVSTFLNNNNHSNHDSEGMMITYNNNNLFDRHGNGAAVNNMSVLRVGGMINRHLRMRRELSKTVVQQLEEVVEDQVQMDAQVSGGGYVGDSGRSEHVNKANMVTAAAVRGGDASTSSMTTASSSSQTDETTFIIETPLFPIILPKAWEAPFKGTSSYSLTKSTSTTTTATGASPSTSSSSSSYIESLEITIAPPESTTSTTSTTGSQPTQHQLQAATLPLIPKSTWESFTGNEFFHPQTYNGLVSTGVLMGSTVLSEEYVTWSGDKKTEKFLKEHNSGGESSSSSSWYEALDSSQEVLVWSGKFIGDKDLYGAELPIIKTTSIIHKSPKYLAELLMDSTKVKAYNKMSLGRDDVEVFQSGVDTTEEEGKFGNVGESKIVRNLTRPPMVNSNLEFVTCMHARKLSQQDLQTLSTNNNDPNQPTDGYIVVSRAVTGGQWNSDDSKNVRNEIILGVNILRQVPNEPDKTELIAVTHVYSPMIPLMLAKNAGVKGAVDFVRDIRSLP